ncbi:MAG: DUF202 domain-containing protein [Elusimicrobia bacterium]|nr:DUF202 domain-containing protein [Elusimicrobiota bacterium]
MNDSHYSRFNGGELILRDELAIDRTLLANERTLLAYLRCGVTLLLAGVSIVHFSHEGWFRAAGFACIPTGIVTGIIGMARYRRMNKAISIVRDRAGLEPGKGAERAEP